MKITNEQLKDAVMEGVVPPHMKDRYTLRINSAEAKNSKSAANNFMIEVEAEIVKPLEKEFFGTKYALDSLKVRYYFMVTIFGEGGEIDAKKTSAARKKLLDLHGRLGLPEELDDENPNTKQYVGLIVDAIVSSREKLPVKPDPNKPGAYVKITDANGKPISQGWELNAQMEDILGISKEELPTPF